MESNIIAFYALTFVLLGSAVGMIFFPKMYMSLLSFFCFVLSSCFLYWELNAKYLSVFQFILCGVILCGYLFLLLKKIGRLNAELHLKNLLTIVVCFTLVSLFGVCILVFFYEEYNSALYSIFNFVQEKVFDSISFGANLFPLGLIVLLVFIVAIVLRVLLASAITSPKSSGEEK